MNKLCANSNIYETIINPAEGSFEFETQKKILHEAYSKFDFSIRIDNIYHLLLFIFIGLF